MYRDPEDGQPLNTGLNQTIRLRRGLSELTGLLKGFLADGDLSEEEANYLSSWMKANTDVWGHWPASVICQRLHSMYEDGIADRDELEDLRELLSQFAGGGIGLACDQNTTTKLPLDNPPPAIVFEGRTFVLTGQFVMGPRCRCADLIQHAGGVIRPAVTQKTNYLVLGTFASRDWTMTTHGSKVAKAMEFRDELHTGIAIVSEDHWANCLP